MMIITAKNNSQWFKDNLESNGVLWGPVFRLEVLHEVSTGFKRGTLGFCAETETVLYEVNTGFERGTLGTCVQTGGVT